MTPDQYRTHQINLAVDRALTTAMAYGHAEYAYGELATDDPGRDAQRATVQDRYDRLAQIINELRDLALTDSALQERLTEQEHELSQVHEDNERLSRERDDYQGRHVNAELLLAATERERDTARAELLAANIRADSAAIARDRLRRTMAELTRWADGEQREDVPADEILDVLKQRHWEDTEGADVVCADPDCGESDCTGEHGLMRCPSTGQVNQNLATVAGRWTCCGGLYPEHTKEG